MRYRHPIALQERFQANDTERTIISKALELRATLAMPFWDAIMLSLFGVSDDVSCLLQRANLHQDLSEGTFWLSTSDIHSGALANLEIESLDLIGLRSEVRLKNAEFSHIPLLDFHCPSSQNLSIVVQVCTQLFEGRFFVLEIGESYHAYGSSLVSAAELLYFVDITLLLADRRSGIRCSPVATARLLVAYNNT